MIDINDDVIQLMTPCQRRTVMYRLRCLLKKLEAANAVPLALRDGDRDVAEVLLPTWRAAYGACKCQVAQLLKPPAGSALESVAAQWLARDFTSRLAASVQLGRLLDRLAGHVIGGLTVTKHPCGEGNQVAWVCKPAEPPETPGCTGS